MSLRKLSAYEIRNALALADLASQSAATYAGTLRRHPEILPTLRMSTCPPIAVDRLIGLAGVSKSLVQCMEADHRLPPRMSVADADAQLAKIAAIIEAKSAGDFTNTNKRRKEEAVKMSQLRATYGSTVEFNLFLCGYFDSGYLGYEAAEGIDWVWEHRIDDLERFGL